MTDREQNEPGPNQAKHQPRPAMNTALWTLQVLWGVFFSMNGLGKALCYRLDVWNHTVHRVAWFSAVPQDLFVFIGICEFLGGVGLILPAITGVKPKLTPLAAFGLTLVMVFAALFHVVRGEYNFLPINLVLGGVAAFIAYGRFLVRPIEPGSLSAFRVFNGLAVLCALFLGPVWYTLTYTITR